MSKLTIEAIWNGFNNINRQAKEDARTGRAFERPILLCGPRKYEALINFFKKAGVPYEEQGRGTDSEQI